MKDQQTNKKPVKGPQSPWLFYYPHPTEKKEHQEEQRTRETKNRGRWGEGRLPCAVYSGGHREQKAPFARKDKWDSEEMGGKQKVGEGVVVMHRKRGWWAVHFSPTP